MTASYRLIDYSLRPGKFAERKMLSEIFSRLKSFGDLPSYQYIGFGSIWFSDCVLFHKSLGINDIYSIERETDHEARFLFNKPFGGINVLMGHSSEVLLELDWSRRSIVWLDYDDPLGPAILDDVRTVASRLVSGSALAVTVQAEKIFAKRQDEEEAQVVDTAEKFSNFFGPDRTPLDITDQHLVGWTLSKTSRTVIGREIEGALAQVNAARRPDNRMHFKPVAAFEYADGAKMTTLAGVIVDSGQRGLHELCNFGNLPFCTQDESAYRIKVPVLTPREMRHLDRSMPARQDVGYDIGPTPPSDARRYAELYRYLPNFGSFEV